MAEEIKIVIDQDMIDRYTEYYFGIHPKAKKIPILKPAHPSMNETFRMTGFTRRDCKNRWKDFIHWVIDDYGYTDLNIDKCRLDYITYYERDYVPHDTDNLSPKFILDALVSCNFLVADNCHHLRPLLIDCIHDPKHPRMELIFKNVEYKTQYEEDEING